MMFTRLFRPCVVFAVCGAMMAGCTGQGWILPRSEAAVTVFPGSGIAGQQITLNTNIRWGRPVDEGKVSFAWETVGGWATLQSANLKTPVLVLPANAVSDIRYLTLTLSYPNEDVRRYSIPFVVYETLPGGGNGGAGTATVSGRVTKSAAPGSEAVEGAIVFASRKSDETEIRSQDPATLASSDIYGTKVVTDKDGNYSLSGLPIATPIKIVAFINNEPGKWDPLWDIKPITLGSDGVTNFNLVLPKTGQPAKGTPGGILAQVFMPAAGGTGMVYATAPVEMWVEDPAGPPLSGFSDRRGVQVVIHGIAPTDPAPDLNGWAATDDLAPYNFAGEIRVSFFKAGVPDLWWSDTVTYQPNPVINLLSGPVTLHP